MLGEDRLLVKQENVSKKSWTRPSGTGKCPSPSCQDQVVASFIWMLKSQWWKNLSLGVSGPKLSRLEKMTDEIISFRSNPNRPEDGEYMASKVRLFVV